MCRMGGSNVHLKGHNRWEKGNKGIMTERGKVLEAKPVPVPFAINKDGFKTAQNVSANSHTCLLSTNH